jgi:hypothetical protein
MRIVLVVVALVGLCGLGLASSDNVAKGQSCGGAATVSCSGSAAVASCGGSGLATARVGVRRGVVRRVVTAPGRLVVRLAASPRCGG